MSVYYPLGMAIAFTGGALCGTLGGMVYAGMVGGTFILMGVGYMIGAGD